MHALVRQVFSRLHDLDPAAEEAKLASYEDEAQDGEIKMSVSAKLDPAEIKEADIEDSERPPEVEAKDLELTKESDAVAPAPFSATMPRSQCNFL